MTAMWVIYFADVAQGIGIICCLVSATIAVTAIIRWVADYDTAEKAESAAFRKRYFPLAIGLLLITAVIPSKQTIYLMAAAKVGQDIVSSPETKEISGKVLKLINQKLDEQMTGKDVGK